MFLYIFMSSGNKNVHGVSKSSTNNSFNLGKLVVVELLAMFAWFCISYFLWTVFDDNTVFRQPAFLWILLFIGIALTAVAVIYSERTHDKQKNDGCHIPKKKKK